MSFGHRKKLLEAIVALVAAPEAPSPIPVAATEPKTQDTAERRQVTVMFSDLVGSTALSARMDPEDLREVNSAYQKCVAETVRRFGGFVASFWVTGVRVPPRTCNDTVQRKLDELDAMLVLTATRKHDAGCRAAVSPMRSHAWKQPIAILLPRRRARAA